MVAQNQDPNPVPPGYKKTDVGVIPQDWDVLKLGDVFKFLQTGNNSRSDLSEFGEIKYIHYGDLHTKWKYFLDCSKDTIPSIDKNKVKDLPLLEEGDLIMADASEDYEGTGTSVEIKNIRNEKIVAGLHTLLLRGDKNKVADGFKGYIPLIKSFHDSLIRIATGISVYGVSKVNLKQILITIPPLSEQNAIAEVLSDVDALIAALDRLIDKKRQIKLAAMQQLLTGKKRLPGFSGKWVLKKVKQFGEIITGSTPSTKIKEFWNGNIPWVTPTDIKETKDIFHTEREITPLGLASIRKLPSNSVLITCIASIGKNVILRNDGSCNQQINAIVLNKEHQADFVYYLMGNNKQYLLGNSGITATNIISKKYFSELSFLTPPLEEQMAIAEILSHMDAEIQALEAKRQKYQALKLAMMQELLTGKTRLL